MLNKRVQPISFKVKHNTFPIPPSWKTLDGFSKGIETASSEFSFSTPIFWRMNLFSVQRFIFPHLPSYTPRERHLMLSSLCIPEDIRFMGVGYATKNRKGLWNKRISFAEDERGCWSMWQYLIDPMTRNIDESEAHYSALHNHPKPIGLGGWFSTTRWHQLRLLKQKQSDKEIE